MKGRMSLMKKLLLFVMVLILFTCSCGKMEKPVENKKASMEDTQSKPEKEKKENSPEYYCKVLYEPKENSESSYTNQTRISYDFDNDGKDEEIEFVINSDCVLKVISNGISAVLNPFDAHCIYRVYGLDMDTSDEFKELALITEEVSSDVILRVLRTDGKKIYPIEFEAEYDTGTNLFEETTIGYDAKIYMNEKNVIVSSVRGQSGMWSLVERFVFNGKAFRKEDKPAKDVVKSSLSLFYNDVLSEEDIEYMIDSGLIRDRSEIDHLRAGYAVAHCDFENYGQVPPHNNMISICEGDIFKITKEEKDVFVYVKKKDGQSGWLYLGGFDDNRYEVSKMMFFLAD